MEDDWRAVNRARWDELVGVHLAPGGYRIGALRAGTARLDPLVARELGPVDGMRLLHLQCHFGYDTLMLAREGAEVVGLDFSPPAIASARRLADELGLASRARFVESDLYDARASVGEPGAFDRVFVTWGAINWLPDIREWAAIAAHFLKPDGVLFLADQHPAAFVFDDAVLAPNGNPGFLVPYFHSGAWVLENMSDYMNPEAVLWHRTEHVFPHPLGEIVTAVIDAGLTLEYLHEHETIPWRSFSCLVPDGADAYRWPDKPWLPLAFSLRARKPEQRLDRMIA